jgi:hypothetical protein
VVFLLEHGRVADPIVIANVRPLFERRASRVHHHHLSGSVVNAVGDFCYLPGVSGVIAAG